MFSTERALNESCEANDQCTGANQHCDGETERCQCDCNYIPNEANTACEEIPGKVADNY